jgi:DNA topoisomerase-1
MKKLLIVESPSKIKTISKFLGKDFKIMSTMGHIIDLPTKRVGVAIADNNIDIEYEPIDDKEKTIVEICKAAANADEIYLASDPDREGEIISWHVEQSIKKVVKNPKIHRITFNEITKSAVLDAIAHPRDIDLDKVAAQQARRVLDRWVGYDVSPILWTKIAPGLSAGRVQSVALRLICDREEAIRGFKPEEYWTIGGLFKHADGTIEAALSHIGKDKAEITNEKDATSIVAEIKKQNYAIDSITDKERTKNPLPPFMTSTLQQAAFNQLGYSTKKTMQLAQQLYEGVPLEDASTPVALITYMRTDSLRLSDTAITQAREFISKNFDKEYLPSSALVYAKSKAKEATTQDAHEAIRPIDAFITPEKARKYLPKDLATLYELIWKRFIACQMKSALFAQRQVVIKGGKFIFKVTGSTLIFDGFLKVYNDAEEDEEKEGKVVLPKGITKDDNLDLQKVSPKQHFTQPPPRYTEASLVKEMDKEGIGRPSTYNAIMNTIRARQYTIVDTKKRFNPTELGMTVTKLLVENLPKIMDIKFTAYMEEHLDKVANGELNRDELLFGFYEPFSKDVKTFKGQDGKRMAEPTDITCPECGEHKLAIRFGKAGEFLGCLGYPKCSFTSNFKRDDKGVIELVQAAQPQMLEEKCPQCGKPLRQLVGKFGPFVACSGYPDCKYIHHVKAKFPCPQDGGEVIQRKWRGGTFWGCNNYPKCKFAVFGDIEEIPCPKCKLPFLVKKVSKDGKVSLFCSDKNCGYKHDE